MKRKLLIVSLLVTAACDATHFSFVCAQDSDCTLPGQTRPKCVKNDGQTAACAFYSSTCPSEYAYDKSATDGRGDQCVQFKDASAFIWNIEHTIPGKLYAVWGSGADDIYVGGPGYMLRSRGDGVWKKEPVANCSYILSIWGSSSQDIYAVGQDTNKTNVVFHSNGNGTWVSSTPPIQKSGEKNYLSAIGGRGVGDVYAIGSIYTDAGAGHTSVEGALWHSSTVGQWTNMPPSRYVTYLTDVSGTSPANIYIVGTQCSQSSCSFTDTLVLHLGSAGGPFESELVKNTAFNTISGNQSGAVYAGGTDKALSTSPTGRIHRRIENMWKLENDTAPPTTKIWVSPSGEVFAAHGLPQFISYSDGSGKWSYISVPGEKMDNFKIHKVWGSGPNDIYLVGADSTGIIIHGKR